VTYGVEDVSRLVAVPVRTLQRWHREGHLVASCATGGGKHRRYSEADLRRALVMAALRRSGLSRMDQIARATEEVLAVGWA
jgi:DNA-binding transcriptional MerR regulator